MGDKKDKRGPGDGGSGRGGRGGFGRQNYPGGVGFPSCKRPSPIFFLLLACGPTS